jgi:hypothetical protein
MAFNFLQTSQPKLWMAKKTTTVNALSGALPMTYGDILLNGGSLG